MTPPSQPIYPPVPASGLAAHMQASQQLFRKAVEWLEDEGKDMLAGDVFRWVMCAPGGRPVRPIEGSAVCTASRRPRQPSWLSLEFMRS